ncbi:hypothetical protein T439DRAFT_383366 [Meredithblackwellia eburnea MCA 4105]
MTRLQHLLRPLLPSIRPFPSASTSPAFSGLKRPQSTTTPTPEQEPGLPPYYINRTSSNFLPVYLDLKSGGSRQETLIRKIDGDLDALKRDLEKAFPLSDPFTKPQSRQVVLRGDWVTQVKEWLETKF